MCCDRAQNQVLMQYIASVCLSLFASISFDEGSGHGLEFYVGEIQGWR